MPYVSRGGDKLAHALDIFGVDPRGRVCADLGCSTGGFTDVLLRRDASRVYAVDTGYGVLDWRLRNDDRVIVMERTNALHVELPEACGLVVIDAGWTRQARLVPRALEMLAPGGEIVSLLKPHYEAPREWLRRGVLLDEKVSTVVESVAETVETFGVRLIDQCDSPVLGAKGNREVCFCLAPLQTPN